MKTKRLVKKLKNCAIALLCFFMGISELTAQGCSADGGMLTGGPFTFDMVGDGTADNI